MTNCKNCGAPLGEGMTFCTNCGTRIVPPQPEKHSADTTAAGREQTRQDYSAYDRSYPVRESYELPEPGVGNWVLSIFLTGIPVVGLIMLLVWALSGSTPTGKRNWAIATLIWGIIGIAFTIFAVAVLGFSLVD